ncbi:hypothetical protein K1X84_13485 [bacterium]|nr:hypothetical protein [bacterium]
MEDRRELSQEHGHEKHVVHAEHVGAEHGGVDYERRDANPKKILIFTVTLVIIIAGLIMGLSEYFLFVTDAQVAEAVLKKEDARLRDLHAMEDEVLNSYKVLDAEKGIYQIPINRAMEVLADEAFRAQQMSSKK